MCASNLDEMTRAYERQNWPAVMATADRLRTADPTCHRDCADGMLFEALYESGRQLVELDRVVGATRMFDRAPLLRPDEPRAARGSRSEPTTGR